MNKLFLTFLLTTFLIASVSAAEWDNVKSYNSITKEVTLKNALGLPLIGDDIAKIKLDTPQVNKVGLGYVKVAEFTIESYIDYLNFIQEFEIINMKTGKAEKVQIDLKYKIFNEVSIKDFEEVCTENKDLKNATTVCSLKEVGSHIEQQEEWLPLEKLDVKAEKITIGIFTETKEGDHYDWIPTFAGVKVLEWAEWDASLNTGLVNYYNFEQTGVPYLDLVSSNDLTAQVGTVTSEATGKIGRGISINDGNNYLQSESNIGIVGNQPRTACWWIDIDTVATEFYWLFWGTGTQYKIWSPGYYENAAYKSILATNNQDLKTAQGLSTSSQFLCFNTNGTHFNYYSQGTKTASIAITNTLDTGNSNLTVGAYIYGGNIHAMDSMMDELGIWNRTLSSTEITTLYASGDGMTYAPPSYPPIITLNAPIDVYNSTSSSITFNASAYAEGDGSIANVTLYKDGVLNETNSSAINNTNYIFTKAIADGAHNWSIKGCNSYGCTDSATRTFTIDTVAPTISIASPSGYYGILYDDYNHTINFTATDTRLDKCWYDYNGTNTTLSCTTATPVINYFNQSLINYDLRVWANDTLGNKGTALASWSYKIFENSKTYTSAVFDTALTNYGVNVTANSSLTGVQMDYNGTLIPLINQGSGIWNYSRQTPTSAVGSNYLSFKYTYGGENFTSSNSTQQVNAVVFIPCNSTATDQFLNITFKDEASLSYINATIPTSEFVYYLGDGTVNKTLTYSNASENYNYTFCGNTSGTPLYVVPTVQYKQGTLYPQRIWNPTLQTYNSTITTQVLYLLSSTDGLYVTFQVIDSTESAISGVEVNASREVDGSTVEIAVGTTDSSGLVTFWLNPDFLHEITFSKSGYSDYTTSLFPTQSSYTVTLGTGVVTTPEELTGISWVISPAAGFLDYFEEYDFKFSLTSDYFSLDEFGFDLNWSNGTLIERKTSTNSTGGILTVADLNVSNVSYITMSPFYTIDGEVSTLDKRVWSLQSTSGREFSLYQWFSDFTTYTSTGTSVLGFDDFGKLILTALVLILLVGGLSQRYGLQSEAAITGILFSVIFFLEYSLEWIPVISTPLGTLPRGTLTVVSGIILIAGMIAGERR